MVRRTTRRDVVKALGIGAVVAGFARPSLAQGSAGRVVIVGGGFGGATAARFLRRIAPQIEVTLIEPSETFITCPFSNTVIGGLNPISAITHTYDGLKAAGVKVVKDRVTAIDAPGKNVRLAGGGANAPYDRLIVSPGIDFKWNAVEGYNEAAAEIMPHAYKAGPQTLLLRKQLEEMPDGGTVVMAVPANPYRCPPGPYERASLIAAYLKKAKPRSKIIILDAKDAFSKMALFREAWAQLYQGTLEWVPFAMNGNFRRVDPATKTVVTDFGQQKGDVVNFIPPQRSALIVDTANLAEGDWCNVNPTTFESKIVPGIHVLGDAIVAGAMPKSGFSAGSQAKVCAFAVAALLRNQPVAVPTLLNTCYSLVADDYGISVTDVFKVADNGTITAVMGAGGVSPTGQNATFHALEAGYAKSWYANITKEMFG